MAFGSLGSEDATLEMRLMPEYTLPLTLIYVYPLLSDISRLLNYAPFERYTARKKMSIVGEYLNYVCMRSINRRDPIKYDYGLPDDVHENLVAYLDGYVSDMIADQVGMNLSNEQIKQIKLRLLFKVTGSQALPIIISVDSENSKDRELYDAHM